MIFILRSAQPFSYTYQLLEVKKPCYFHHECNFFSYQAQKNDDNYTPKDIFYGSSFSWNIPELWKWSGPTDRFLRDVDWQRNQGFLNISDVTTRKKVIFLPRLKDFLFGFLLQLSCQRKDKNIFEYIASFILFVLKSCFNFASILLIFFRKSGQFFTFCLLIFSFASK